MIGQSVTRFSDLRRDTGLHLDNASKFWTQVQILFQKWTFLGRGEKECVVIPRFGLSGLAVDGTVLQGRDHRKRHLSRSNVD